MADKKNTGKNKEKTENTVTPPEINEEIVDEVLDTGASSEIPMEEQKENFGDRASKFADKSAEVAGKVFDNLKKGVSQAYDVGSKWAGELNHLAQEYAVKYNNYVEVSKLTKKKNNLAEQLGKITYNTFNKDSKLPDNFLEQKEVAELLEQINKLDKEIVAVGKELDSKNQ